MEFAVLTGGNIGIFPEGPGKMLRGAKACLVRNILDGKLGLAKQFFGLFNALFIDIIIVVDTDLLLENAADIR